MTPSLALTNISCAFPHAHNIYSVEGKLWRNGLIRIQDGPVLSVSVIWAHGPSTSLLVLAGPLLARNTVGFSQARQLWLCLPDTDTFANGCVNVRPERVFVVLWLCSVPSSVRHWSRGDSYKQFLFWGHHGVSLRTRGPMASWNSWKIRSGFADIRKP